MIRTWNDALEGGEHLTAIADPQREAVTARKELLELIAHGRMEQDRLGPPFPRSKNVAVRKSAAGHHTLELAQRAPAGQQVGHVNVVRFKPGPLEHRSRLGLTVDALLSENRHGRTRTPRNVGRRDVLFRIESQRHRQTGIVRGTLRLVLLIGALRVIAQAPHAPRGFGPRATQLHPRFIELRCADADAHTQLGRGRSQAQRRIG